MRLRSSFETTRLRLLLSCAALLSLFGCVRRAEVKTVRSNGSLSATTDLTQRVVTGLGYTAAPEEGSTENVVVASTWQDYPPGHAAAGAYSRRAVVVLREKAATRKRPAVIDADVRIDVGKCTWSLGQRIHCHLMDRHYDEDERDLDTLAARLLMAYEGKVSSALSRTTDSSVPANVQRPSEETTVKVTRPDTVPAPAASPAPSPVSSAQTTPAPAPSPVSSAQTTPAPVTK